MKKRFLIGIGFGFAAALQAADAYEIMSHSLKKADENWSQAPNFSYTRTDVSGDSSEQPSSKTYEVLMVEGSPYLKIVAQGGHPLPAATARDEERKFQRETDRRRSESPRERQKRMQKYLEDRNRDHAFLAELASAFEYSLIDDGQSGKGAFWLVKGKPKPGYIATTREGKVLSGMSVEFWIDKTTCQWVRVEAEVEQPVSIYGLIAKVEPGTKFTLEQEPVSGNVWLPSRFTMRLNATALGFIKKDSVQDRTYANYRFDGDPSPEARAFGTSAGRSKQFRDFRQTENRTPRNVADQR